MTSGINFQAQALSGIFGQYSCLQQQLPFSRLWAKGVSQNDNGGNVAPNLWFRSKLSAPKGTKLTKPGFAFGCLQFNCMAQFCSKTVALLMPGPMLAQEPHLKYVWCTHTQYGENYAFVTNPATTGPKEQCVTVQSYWIGALVDAGSYPHGINPLQGETTSGAGPMRQMRKDLAARIPKSMDLWQHNVFMLNIQDE